MKLNTHHSDGTYRKYQSINCILLDLDGTLIDSEGISFQCTDTAFRQVMGRGITPEERDIFMGRPVSILLSDMFGTRGEEIAAIGKSLYMKKIPGLNLYDGIMDVLLELKKMGLKMGIVTSSRREPVNEIMKSLKIENLFSTVVTQESTERHKPQPDPVFKALEETGTLPKNAIFIGDQPWDMQSANAAGVRSYGASWGPGRESLLRRSGAISVLRKPSSILRIIRGYPQQLDGNNSFKAE
jgi:pyrophosphatase PpaX